MGRPLYPTPTPNPNPHQVSEWGVRFTFGLGSVAFLVSSMLSFPELLSD